MARCFVVYLLSFFAKSVLPPQPFLPWFVQVSAAVLVTDSASALVLRDLLQSDPCPTLHFILCLSDPSGAITPQALRPEDAVVGSIVSFPALMEFGTQCGFVEPNTNNQGPATIVYTSGTTGISLFFCYACFLLYFILTVSMLSSQPPPREPLCPRASFIRTSKWWCNCIGILNSLK